MNAIEILKDYYGYTSFRKGQAEIINASLLKRDCLAIMPTGSGKSVCYQIPALLFEGITIVVSPLISLMQDQVSALNAMGIHAAYINSSLTESQITKALQYAAEGKYKIIYVAPERLDSQLFVGFTAKVKIDMVTVDEAHCISQWGQDFRPSYLKIKEFIDKLSYRPVVSAFTATATEKVKSDIVYALGLNSPEIIVTGFDRPNLYFGVERTNLKDDYTLSYVKKHAGESGIIYCATRKNVEKVYDMLSQADVNVTKYHAGMDNEARKKSQQSFVYDEKDVIVATNAFGMGIDKSNVRYVLHYNMPQSIENYYQEAGRAGRDGENAECILLYSAQDIIINRYLLDHKETDDVNLDYIRKIDEQRLKSIEKYCTGTVCLRKYILEYFGETVAEDCDNCSNCKEELQEIDCTETAKKIISCIAELHCRYGVGTVVGVLRGNKTERLQTINAGQLTSFASLSELSDERIKELLNCLISEGYITKTDDIYGVLGLSEKITFFNNDSNRIILKVRNYVETKTGRKSKHTNKNALSEKKQILFEILRNTRTEVANDQHVPPYVIFSDASLVDMCAKLPSNKQEMCRVYGIGERKYEKYGELFLNEIKYFVAEYPELLTEEKTAATALVNTKEHKNSKKKAEFGLSTNDAEKFDFSDEKTASEIRDCLNAIKATDRKKITATAIVSFLKETKLIGEEQVGGVWKRIILEKGRELGIRSIPRISQLGTEYEILVYPRNIQEIIVESFIDKNVNNNTQDIANSNMERIKAENPLTYMPWTKEEEDVLLDEFSSNISVDEIAKRHSRNVGGIRARLKKLGVI